MNAASVRIAVRGIVANKMRSSLTTLGILIGVASVIILVAVGSGSAAASRERLEALGSNTLTVQAGGFGFGNRGGTQARRVEITDKDVKALQDRNNAPDVVEVVPTVNVQGATVVYQGASTSPSQTQGTTPNFAEVRGFDVDWGSFFADADYEAHRKLAILGTTVVKDLLGEAADPESMIGEEIKLNGVAFTVGGVFETRGSNGFQDQDDLVIIPMTTARDSLTGSSGRVDGLTVQAESSDATTAAQNQVTAVLLAQHPGASSNDYLVLNQASLQETQEASNRTFTVLLGAVAAISLLVGGIGVMNIMLVTVTERTREIGIRKAVGAQRSHIITQFLVEAVLLSGLGGLLGVAVGTGLFFGLYPANRAANLRPIDALRYE